MEKNFAFEKAGFSSSSVGIQCGHHGMLLLRRLGSKQTLFTLVVMELYQSVWWVILRITPWVSIFFNSCSSFGLKFTLNLRGATIEGVAPS